MKHNKYWFTPKTYGYGAQPSSWEGWTSILVFAIVFLGILKFSSVNEFRFYGIFNILAVVIFVYFCNKKTNGTWKWRWGNK
jgi:hypothetical protein